ATLGAANEVPDHIAHPSNRSGSKPPISVAGPSWKTNVLITPTPGAEASTHGPWLLNQAGWLQSRAPTAMTPGSAAGQDRRQVASFPAEATTTAPFSCSRRTASDMARGGSPSSV